MIVWLHAAIGYSSGRKAVGVLDGLQTPNSMAGTRVEVIGRVIT